MLEILGIRTNSTDQRDVRWHRGLGITNSIAVSECTADRTGESVSHQLKREPILKHKH